MKHEIKVNKQAQIRLQEEEVQKVIKTAITFANHGYDLFYHPRPSGIDLSAHELIEMVEKETDLNVYGGVSGNQIKFRIRD